MTRLSRKAKGFTLIELMIVVAIIAILAAIAYPSYINHMVDTRRTTATGCLIEQAQYMERQYTTNMSYVLTIDRNEFQELFNCKDDLVGFYTFDFTADPTATAYTLQAVPQGVQAQRDTECGTLTLNQVGTRTESGSGDVAGCW